VRHAATHKFLIVRLGSLGDVVHAIPVAAALRERFPSSRIDWLVDPRYVELLEHVRGIDAPIPVRLGRRPLAAMSMLKALRRVSYTAALDLQGLVKSAMLARAVGAWRTIGFPRAHLREPMARHFYSETPEPAEHTHVVHKNLSLLTPLGAREVQPSFPIEVPVTPVAEEIASRGPYAVINPGAAWPNKRWAPQRFGDVAAALRDRLGIRSLVAWGPGERALASAVVSASDGAADLAPATTVSDLLGVSRVAKVMISGDTGPLHLAAAVGTPVVALFGPTLAWRNGPWSPADTVLSRTDTCGCLYKRRCRKKTPCIQDIGVEEVVTTVMRRIGR
jgi:lipopolysaccharide heptosyltransferase I